MFYNSNWIHSFPQNYQWSNAILVTKGMASYGAVAMGEIDIVTQKLHSRISEPHAWWEEWSAMADLEKIDGPLPAKSRSPLLRFSLPLALIAHKDVSKYIGLKSNGVVAIVQWILVR